MNAFYTCAVISLYACVPDRPLAWDIPHVSETFDCNGCFAFSAADICSHSRSDHNFYAVCQVRMKQALQGRMLPSAVAQSSFCVLSPLASSVWKLYGGTTTFTVKASVWTATVCIPIQETARFIHSFIHSIHSLICLFICILHSRALIF
jgi:hypothetical protein